MAESQFSRPTLLALINRMRSELFTRLDLDDDLRRADAEVYARVEAEGLNGVYGYIDWLAKQFLPDQAGQEGVERWANMLGEWYTPATAASGSVPVIGTLGSPIPLDARWQNASGVLYRPTASVVLDASPQLVAIVCEDTGVAGNLVAGELLTLISPQPGVQSQSAVVAPGIAGGAAADGVEDLRDSVMRRLRTPPQGGSKTDYEMWALAAHPSVTRAWVYPQEAGPNTVVVRVVCDNLADPIPTAQVLAAVAAYIDARRPVTANVQVLAPVAVAQNFTIDLTPDNVETRARVRSGLQDLLRRESIPGGTLLRTHIAEAISLAQGESNHVLSVPPGDVVRSVGEFAVMGVITWL